MAIEKKMTVPPSGDVERMAPCSHPGTSTHTTVMSAGPSRASSTAVASATGSRASAIATTSASPTSDNSVASAANGHDPNGSTSTGVAGSSQRQRPALAGAADHRDGRSAAAVDVLTDHPGGEGWRTSDVHHRHRQCRRQVVGHRGSDRAAEEDGVTLARHLLAEPVPRARPSVMTSGVRLSDTRVVICWPTATSSADCGADGVHRADEHATRTGDRVLHLSSIGDDLEHLELSPAHRRRRAW